MSEPYGFQGEVQNSCLRERLTEAIEIDVAERDINMLGTPESVRPADANKNEEETLVYRCRKTGCYVTLRAYGSLLEEPELPAYTVPGDEVETIVHLERSRCRDVRDMIGPMEPESTEDQSSFR